MPFPQFNVLMANRRPTQGHFHYYERHFYDLTIKIQLFININYDFIICIIIEFILATENVIYEDIQVKWSSKGPQFTLPMQNFEIF